MNRFDTYVKALWTEYKIWGFVIVFVLIVAALYLFKVDVGQFINNWLGR